MAGVRHEFKRGAVSSSSGTGASPTPGSREPAEHASRSTPDTVALLLSGRCDLIPK